MKQSILASLSLLLTTVSPLLAEDLSPLGKPEQNLVKVNNARYYIWHDSTGWHLRTASRRVANFIGSIKLEGGSFRKLRTIGFETKGSAADCWGVNPERTELRFEIITAGSFDGFDFDIRGQDAEIVYDLKVFKTAAARADRIYIGRSGTHPKEAKFTLPADPRRKE